MRTTVSHEFVNKIPDEPEEGVVYVSIPYTTAVHRCCCGCGHEVVTPLHPLQWSLTFNGETISLTPSIGNWSFPCRSHYWIRTGEVCNARPFSDTEIANLRADDRELLLSHYGPRPAAPEEATEATRRVWSRLIGWSR